MAADRSTAELEDFLTDRADHLLRTAALLAGSREAGEDLLQTAVERLLRRWRRFDGDPEGYLRRTLCNLATDGYRRAGRWRAKEPPLQARHSPAQQAVRRQAHRAHKGDLLNLRRLRQPDTKIPDRLCPRQHHKEDGARCGVLSQGVKGAGAEGVSRAPSGRRLGCTGGPTSARRSPPSPAPMSWFGPTR
jgi:hypothetical protein